jgi:hypothetical protein
MLWDGRMHELFGIEPGSFSGKYVDFLALVHSGIARKWHEKSLPP